MWNQKGYEGSVDNQRGKGKTLSLSGRYKLEKALKKEDSVIKTPEAPPVTTEDSSSEAPSGVQKPEAVATGDTDSVVARQNQLNERQVQGMLGWWHLITTREYICFILSCRC